MQFYVYAAIDETDLNQDRWLACLVEKRQIGAVFSSSIKEAASVCDCFRNPGCELLLANIERFGPDGAINVAATGVIEVDRNIQVTRLGIMI